MGVLDSEDREKDNETGLKEGGKIEMSTKVLPLRDARSLRIKYLLRLVFDRADSTRSCSSNTSALSHPHRPQSKVHRTVLICPQLLDTILRQ